MIKKNGVKHPFISLLNVFFGLTMLLTTSAFAVDEHEWGYSCDYGPPPAEWYKDFEECAGTEQSFEQSPIDICTKRTKPGHVPQLRFNYGKIGLLVKNNGHTIKAEVIGNASIKVGYKIYKLLQFHWHTPSEHWLNGESYPGELHLVHQSEEGEYLVVGVLYEIGSKNNELNRIWDSDENDEIDLINEESEPISIVCNNVYDDDCFDLKKLLPCHHRNIKVSYRYNGSFTTPPCTQDIKWIVLGEKAKLASSQIEAFERIFLEEDHFPAGNARPVQPLRGRIVRRGYR